MYSFYTWGLNFITQNFAVLGLAVRAAFEEELSTLENGKVPLQELTCPRRMLPKIVSRSHFELYLAIFYYSIIWVFFFRNVIFTHVYLLSFFHVYYLLPWTFFFNHLFTSILFYSLFLTMFSMCFTVSVSGFTLQIAAFNVNFIFVIL